MPVAYRLPPATAIRPAAGWSDSMLSRRRRSARRQPRSSQTEPPLSSSSARSTAAGSVQCETRTQVSAPGASVNSQAMWLRMRLPRPASPSSTIRNGGSVETIVVSIQTLRIGPLTQNRAPAPTPTESIRVRWKSVRKWSVKEGRAARSRSAAKTCSRGASISISALTGPIKAGILVAGRLEPPVRRIRVTGPRERVSIARDSVRKERFPIFESVGTSPAGDAFTTGSMPGEGTYFCLVCGTQLALRETDHLPQCSVCGSSRFRRDSIFAGRQEHGTPTREFAVPAERESPGWLDEAREQLSGPGYHLALRERGEVATYRLEIGWTKVGRCERAEICLDDPSVSRRHALIATDEDRPPRILDDRSLNGILVNGRKVEWTELKDGDELTLGRYRLFLLQA